MLIVLLLYTHIHTLLIIAGPRGFQKDFCSEQGGCLNGGTCVNQCLGAVCLCRPPYTAGRRCEQCKCV